MFGVIIRSEHGTKIKRVNCTFGMRSPSIAVINCQSLNIQLATTSRTNYQCFVLGLQTRLLLSSCELIVTAGLRIDVD